MPELTKFDRLAGGELWINRASVEVVYPTKFLSDNQRPDIFGRECLEIMVAGNAYTVTDTESHRELLGLPSRKIGKLRAAKKAT